MLCIADFSFVDLASMNQYQLIDGTKSISLDQLPESAWTVTSGDGKDSDDERSLYAVVAYLYNCVEKRANAIAGLPWYIMRNKSELWSYNNDTVPAELAYLAHLPELLWQSEAALSLGSEAFWHKERNRVRVTGIRWQAPWTIEPQWDESAGLTSYKRTLGMRTITYAPEEVVYLHLPGQHETKPRTSPAHAAMAAAGVIHGKDVFAKTFFDRGAIKATLLQVTGNPLPEERKRLKNWWRRAFESVGNAFSTEVISADAVTPVVVGEGLDALNANGLAMEMREDISTALGVPHSMVVSNASNFATAKMDRFNFYDLTIVPESQIIARQLNNQLFGPLGLRFEFRPQEMDLYQEDENERADALVKYVNAGIPLNIAIQMLGLELPEGVTPESLLPPEPVIEVMPVEQPKQTQPQATDPIPPEKAVEIQVFRRWLSNRRHPDPSAFNSDLLTHDEKIAIMEDATGNDAPFLAWSAYP